MAEWSQSYKNSLPDSCFLVPGKRVGPYKTKDGKVDLPHLTAALRLLPRAKSITAQEKKAALAKAQRLLDRAKGKLRESARVSVAESDRARTEPLREAAVPGAFSVEGFANCVLVQEGMNAIGTRYYTEDFLRNKVLPRVQGSLCHIDHPTVSESLERPERSLSTVAAVITNPRWDSVRRSLVGDLEPIEGTAPAAQVASLFANPTVRENAGLSLYYPYGFDGDWKVVNGRTIAIPTDLLGPETARFGFDFVTTPTAGGRVGPQST